MQIHLAATDCLARLAEILNEVLGSSSMLPSNWVGDLNQYKRIHTGTRPLPNRRKPCQLSQMKRSKIPQGNLESQCIESYKHTNLESVVSKWTRGVICINLADHRTSRDEAAFTHALWIRGFYFSTFTLRQQPYARTNRIVNSKLI